VGTKQQQTAKQMDYRRFLLFVLSLVAPLRPSIVVVFLPRVPVEEREEMKLPTVFVTAPLTTMMYVRGTYGMNQ